MALNCGFTTCYVSNLGELLTLPLIFHLLNQENNYKFIRLHSLNEIMCTKSVVPGFSGGSSHIVYFLP